MRAVEITKEVRRVGDSVARSKRWHSVSRLSAELCVLMRGMMVTLRSFAKINFGLCIGAPRKDGFHELLTVYQTIGLHDMIKVSVERGRGIEIRCTDPRVPKDESNTCYRIVESARRFLGAKGRVVIEIEKRLSVQGGLGGASANAAAALLGFERAIKKLLSASERLRIAAEVGSDLPLFLVGGTVLGVGRGEQVYPLQDLPAMACVVVTPALGVSTPRAFADWDRLCTSGQRRQALTRASASDRIIELSRAYCAWLGMPYSGAPLSVDSRRSRAENPLLELVRAGIMNDFERVVFPEYPELYEAKRALEHAGAKYASLSGSGSSLYGLYRSRLDAARAAARLRKQGWAAEATVTLTRRHYWKRLFV
jgi:4-diphosphocytidyl-2-C-methyl-D-erythritol kinase